MFYPFYFIQRNNALHSIHKLITTREDCRKSVSNCHLKFCIGSQLINVFLLVYFNIDILRVKEHDMYKRLLTIINPRFGIS